MGATDTRAALEQLALRLGGEGAKLTEASRLSGGASMETWAFTVDGPKGRDELVLRRRTAPYTDGADVRSVPLATEAALIKATGALGAPVPALVHLCDEQDDMGEAHVTRRVLGETLGRKINNDPAFDAVRGKLAWQCGRVLAQIHSVTPPPEVKLQTSDAASELSRYEAIYRQIGNVRPVLELALRYLRGHLPEPVAPKLLHGDFRNGNMIISPDVGVAAVLDWELAHFGDPAEDLSWVCINSWRFGHPELPVGGFGQYQELLDGYEAAGGDPIPLARVRFWQMLGSLKWGIMCMIMYRMWSSGGDRSVERPMIGRRVSEAEIDLVNLLEAGL